MNGEEQQLTKKQRKELRRQERREEEARQRKSSSMKKVFIWLGGIAVVALIIWGIVSAGGNGGSELAADNDPYEGGADATVVMTEYSDFQCPACKSAVPVVKQLHEAYGDQLKIVYNNFPLSSIHQNSDEAARAGECAFDQDMFWEYHDMLFDHQDTWENLANPKDAFFSYADDLGMDTDLFSTCYDGSDAKSRVDYDKREGNALGINSTPTFIINGEKVSGARPFEDFKEIIDKALAEAAPTPAEE